MLVESAIAPDYLATRPHGDLAVWALASALTVFPVAMIPIPVSDWTSIWPLFASIACVVFALSSLRNRVLRRVYRHFDIVRHYKWKLIVSAAVAEVCVVLVELFAVGLFVLHVQSFWGPTVSLGLIMAAVYAGVVGPVLTDDSKAFLCLRQCITTFSTDAPLDSATKWLDRGLANLTRTMRRFGIRLNGPRLRLGGRLYCYSHTELPVIVDLAESVRQIYDPLNFVRLRQSVQWLELIARDSIANGLGARPQLSDYLDPRHLTLQNLQYILAILISFLVIVAFLYTGKLPVSLGG